MKLSNNQFNVYPRIAGKESGQTISFDELVKKIKTPNQVVDLARQHGKGSAAYDELKINNLEFFYPNLWSQSNVNNPKYNYGTGYVYLDIDCKSEADAIEYRSQLIKGHPYIYACWLSLSNRGLGVLVKVENGGKFYFDQYWKKLNEIIDGVDSSTKNYNRKCVISYDPSVYINKDCVTLDSVYRFDQDSIKYCTPVDDQEFENINTPVVYANGKDVLSINLFKFKNGKIKEGHRYSTIGRIGCMLLHLNPDADYNQLKSAIKSINDNYCSPPLNDGDLMKSLKGNYCKFKKGELDVTGYYTKKYIFWHPLCQLNKSERISIGRKKLSESRFIQNEQLVLDTIEVLKKQQLPIDVKTISEYTSLTKDTIYRIINRSKKVSSERYLFAIAQYNPSGNNMSRCEKVSPDDTFLNKPNNNTTTPMDKDHTPTQYKIYEALEDLQDNVNKITQQRIAEHTGLSIITIKRHWIESFKDLVKDYNNSLKPSKRKPKRYSGDPITTITRAIVALQDTHITKESIAEHTGMTTEEVEQYWTDGIQDLVNRVNSNRSKSGIVNVEPEEDYNVAGYRNLLNPLTDENRFDEFVEELKRSKLYNHEVMIA